MKKGRTNMGGEIMVLKQRHRKQSDLDKNHQFYSAMTQQEATNSYDKKTFLSPYVVQVRID